MSPEVDSIIIILAGIVIVFFLVALVVALIHRFDDFSRELMYINQEIHRTRGEERRHWKGEKKRLWLSLLPFYRR